MDKLDQTDSLLNTRELGKSKNRRHLLDSAANAIFKYGFRGATIANIQKESGLSRGMINLHFETKENLLLAVAQDLSRHYAEHWEHVVKDPELSPAEKLRGIITTDLSEEVLNARDVAIWFAFRSEVASHPEYGKYIDSRDEGFRAGILVICTQLIEEGQYANADATLAANSLIALLEGMWTDFHLHSDHFDRKRAEETCLYVVRSFFPNHF
ncbi:TetR/AcrR family transcriptional regulator [Ruegeria arenilitoris]|uniref:TetR/AcrR family transcriptional regulator n=1 Tax=Ruegeria arenilitoris TaxID=1173585 RepID=UPI00147C906F|nr:TetR/AcrR family transcriptional regulator [Ruegeria arenilitoris]